MLQLCSARSWWHHWKGVLEITQWIALVEQRFLESFTSFVHEAFKSEWVNFLQKGTTTNPDPTFYQYVVGETFDEILKQHCPIVQPTSGVTSQEELPFRMRSRMPFTMLQDICYNHLRPYVSTPSKDHLTLCLIDLTDDADDIPSDSKDWLNVMDQGGLKHANDTTCIYVFSFNGTGGSTLLPISTIRGF